MRTRPPAPVRVKQAPVRSRQGGSQLSPVAPHLSALSHSITELANQEQVAPAYDHPSYSVGDSRDTGPSIRVCEKDTGGIGMTVDVDQRERESRRQRGDRGHKEVGEAAVKETRSPNVVQTTRAGESEHRDPIQIAQLASAVVGAGPSDALGSNHGGQREIPTGSHMPHLLTTLDNSLATQSAARIDSVGETNFYLPWERRSGNIDPHPRDEDPQHIEIQSSVSNRSPPKRREASLPLVISSPPPLRGSSGTESIVGIPSTAAPGVQNEREQDTTIAVCNAQEAGAVEEKRTICLDDGTDSSNASSKHKYIVQRGPGDEAVAPDTSDGGEGPDGCAPMDAEQADEGVSKGSGSVPQDSRGALEPDDPAVDEAISGGKAFNHESRCFVGAVITEKYMDRALYLRSTCR